MMCAGRNGGRSMMGPRHAAHRKPAPRRTPERRRLGAIRVLTQVAIVTSVALAASFAAGAATTSPPTSTTPTSTATTSTATPNPWTYQMTDPNNDGEVIRGVAGSLHNLSTWFDAYGNPVAAVGQVGGFSVFGDNIQTYAPGNIFKPEVQLHDTGGVTLSAGGPTLNGGAGAPAGACTTGSFYFRTNGTAFGQRIYECESAHWVGIV